MTVIKHNISYVVYEKLLEQFSLYSNLNQHVGVSGINLPARHVSFFVFILHVVFTQHSFRLGYVKKKN